MPNGGEDLMQSDNQKPDDSLTLRRLQADGKLNLRRFQRCRGIPIGDGNYTGCAFGDGTVRPFEAPCDCPICGGTGVERAIATRLKQAEPGT